MNRLLLALVGLVCLCAVGSQRATAQDDKRVAELEKRVVELEKKVAALEALSKAPPTPALDNKLVGSWATPNLKGKGISALRFEAGGRCTVVTANEKGKLEFWYGPYTLIGKHIRLVLSDKPFDSGGGVFEMTVVSVGDKELVVKGNFVVPDEVKLERQ
jgi:hypothetical protein